MAGLGRRTFAPGEVLTATNVMGYLQDQAVMNFAGTAARGSAIGTAVSEGMVSYLADSNVVQAYDGSAWNSLAYATAVPNLGAVVPIIPTGVNYTSGTASYNSSTGLVTFTGVTGITPLSVFTSTYRNYTLIGNIDSTSGTGGDFGVRLNNNGTDSTTVNYYTSGNWSNSQSASNLYYNTGAGLGYFGNLFSTADAYTTFRMNIYNPQVTKLTTIETLLNGLSGSGNAANYQSAVLNNLNSSFNGITLFGVSGTSMTGTVKIYGWN